MHNSIKTLIAATAIGAATVAAVQPAEARDHTGATVAAGIIGLGVGAAIASSADRHRSYDYGYYDAGYQPYGYYGSPTVVYDRGYYQDRGWHRGWDRDRAGWGHHGWDRDRDWHR